MSFLNAFQRRRVRWLRILPASLLVSFLLPCFPAEAQSPIFPGKVIPVDLPFGIVTADFNGDGKPDLATVNCSASNVSVYLNDGGGHFPIRADYTAGSFSFALATADFNHDGKADITTADHIGNTVSVRLGNGDGTFQPPVAYPVTPYPELVVVADVNGDGHPDILSRDFGSGILNIHPGRGDGTFGDREDYLVSRNSVGFVVTDLNNDGNPDLGVANTNADAILVVLNQLRTVSGMLTLEDIVPNAPPQEITFTLRPDEGDSFIRTIPVGPSGVFTLPGLPADLYTLHIKGAKYLASNVDVNVTTGGVTGILALLRTGDANNDNGVDVFDLDQLIQAFNACNGDAAYLSGADFNADGCVDIFDLDLLIRNFNTLGDP